MIESVRSRTVTLTVAAIQELESAIYHGVYPPGSRLPSEAQLTRMLGVSRITVREALRRMEERGMVVRRQGVGTFVRSDSILNYLNENFSVVEAIRAANMVYSVSDIHLEMKTADADMAKALQLQEGDPVLELERTRVADGRPVAYTIDRYPGAIVSDIEAIRNEAAKGSLYSLLRDRFQIFVSHGIAHLTCLGATPIISNRLKIKISAPVFNLTQTDFTVEDRPVIYTVDYYVPGIFDFMIFRKGAGTRL